MNQKQPDTLRFEIDRLVGGDLSESETRKLVEQLNATADGWKRCALSFMEAQSWQQTFRSIVPTPKPAGVTVRGKPAVRSRRFFVSAISMCAFAIGVGLTITWERFRATPSPTAPVAVENPREKNPEIDNKQLHVAAQNRKPRVVGLVRVSNDGVVESAFSLVDNSKPEFVSIVLASKSLSEYDCQVLERRGFHIKKHRKLVSVVLANGNRFQFPVEWTNYQYVGQPLF